MKKVDRQSRAPGASSRLHPYDFKILRDLIHERSGLYFQDSKRYVLETRTQRRLEALGMTFFEEYVEYIVHPSNYTETLRLINVITSLETSFFRSLDQFFCIKDVIIPNLIADIDSKNSLQTKSNNTIRFWSAACATGEEVYSLALIIAEHLEPEYPDITFEIVGSDINTIGLHAAEQGIYKTGVLDQIPEEYHRHLVRVPEGIQLSDRIRQKVCFKRINLSDRPDIMRMHHIDFVMCSNVLHSFSADARKQTLQAIYNSMGDASYLMIGENEPLFGLHHPFLEINPGGVKLYHKCA